jgi:hypothetical protein
MHHRRGGYVGGVSTSSDAPDPDVMEIFETVSEESLGCRVCGSLVARSGDFARVHWDWHEATNGA